MTYNDLTLSHSHVINIGNTYTTTSDGYLSLYAAANSSFIVYIYGSVSENAYIGYDIKNGVGTGQSYSLFIKAGMRIKVDSHTATGASITFYDLI